MAAKSVVAFFIWCVSCGLALAQTFPSKPLRIIVPTIAGSAPDVRVRQIAPKLSDAVGHSVIVDNRPGANGTIATQLAARATPDGHTLFYGLINNAISDALHPDVCCRLNVELLPVIHFTSTPLVMVVHPSVAASTLQEYLQLAKSKPSALTYASAGPGSITQLLGEWIKLRSGTRILDVPYKSVGAEMPDLLGGQIMTAYLNPLAVAPHIRSGKLRGLAVAGPKRIAAFPEVPTIAEAGLPGVDGMVWNGFFVPAGTPKQNILILNREILKTFNAPDVREQVAAIGAEIIGGSPESYAAFIRQESAKWGKLIKDVGIKAE
ncbi:MAG: tripartite tricarboxylate transporter substrate-binding protein [Betaproteobacteria bacterium]